MKIGVMQPYFFPYLGHFDLVNQVDEWIVFDTPQYMRHHWVNRNRILHPKNGWQYIIVPVEKHPRDTPINQIRISVKENFTEKILGQLQHYQKKAPYFKQVINFVEGCFQIEHTMLSDLNIHIFKETCRKLEITTPIKIFSEMNHVIEREVEASGEWALEISKSLKATEYLNAVKGVAAGLFDVKKFNDSGVRLSVQAYKNFVYDTGSYNYEPALSIIDVMMWNSPEVIKDFLDKSKQEQLLNNSPKI
jgi:hypothetical protein